MLSIFPEGGLASSVITTVWVGVWVVCFFNLRFGWVLSGLVVPGYLVPLVILKPLAAGVIFVEAIITYLLVYLFSEKLGKGRWHSIFGRDRFVALVIASIAVRLTMDGWLLPLLADWLGDRVGQFDWRNNLQSLGLVIVSLLANQFWKPGLARGLFAAVVTTGLAFVIVRYGLMEFTNFRISGISYLYEGLASSILASPKAYIILVLTAVLASRMNLRYGWDFSGVLIPALIALQWYQPTKILTSFIEAGVIYALASLVLRTPLFANTTIEGARKILLFFNISFLYKIVLGYAVLGFSIDIKTTDLFGFGYLLSTLIAIKAHDKNIFPRLLRSTLQVSLMGAALGNVAGFALSAAVPGVTRSLTDLTSATAERRGRYAALALAAAAGDAHLRRIRGSGAALSPGDAAELGRLVALIESGSGAAFLRESYQAAGWQLRSLRDGSLLIQRADGRGRDAMLYFRESQNDIAIVVPEPASLAGMTSAALALREQQDARWLVVGSPPGPTGAAGQSLISAFAAASTSEPVILAGEEDGVGQLRLAGVGAGEFDVAGLRSALPSLQVAFSAPPPRFAATLPTDTVSLLLGRADIEALVSPAAGVRRETKPCEVVAVAAEEDILLAELGYLRFEVMAPMLASLARGEEPGVARVNADLLDFNLEPCDLSGRPMWRLAANDGSSGTFFIAAAQEGRFLIQAQSAEGSTLPVGRKLAESDLARALLVAPQALTYSASQRSSFGVVSQAMLAGSGSPSSPLLIQLRAAPRQNERLPDGTDLVIAADILGADDEVDRLFSEFARSSGYSILRADRTRNLAPYDAGRNRALRSLAMLENGRFAVFWVNADARNAKR